MDTTKNLDDYEAVRVIVTTLTPFKQPDQERILRWAKEKVGLSTADSKTTEKTAAVITTASASEIDTVLGKHAGNIKQFVDQKSPKSDMHFAAVVAYYHRFHAPESERKATINAEDLQDACRKADRERLTRPGQTLINAYHAGLLDRGGRGEFGINSVGENLVAMALPEPADGTSSPKVKKSKTKSKSAKRKQKR